MARRLSNHLGDGFFHVGLLPVGQTSRLTPFFQLESPDGEPELIERVELAPMPVGFDVSQLDLVADQVVTHPDIDLFPAELHDGAEPLMTVDDCVVGRDLNRGVQAVLLDVAFEAVEGVTAERLVQDVLAVVGPQVLDPALFDLLHGLGDLAQSSTFSSSCRHLSWIAGDRRPVFGLVV